MCHRCGSKKTKKKKEEKENVHHHREENKEEEQSPDMRENFPQIQTHEILKLT